MMCAYLDLRKPERKTELAAARRRERVFDAALRLYDRTLDWSLDNPGTIMFVLLVTIVPELSISIVIVPKGFFPQRGHRRHERRHPRRPEHLVPVDAEEIRAVRQHHRATIRRSQNVVGFTGGGGGGRAAAPPIPATSSSQLKPLSRARRHHHRQVIARLRAEARHGRRARGCSCTARQDVRAGGRQGNGALSVHAPGRHAGRPRTTGCPRSPTRCRTCPSCEDVNSDQQDKGLEVELKIDRATAARLGLTATQIDNTLYDAFGQRQVSTIYKDLNQYHVVMEVAPEFWQSPETLNDIYVSTSGGALSGTAGAPARWPAPRPLAPTPRPRRRRGRQSPPTRCATSSSTPSPTARAAAPRPARRSAPRRRPWCRCRPSPASGRARRRSRSITRARSSPRPSRSTCRRACRWARRRRAIQRTMAEIHVPISVHGEFAGTAQLFQQSLANEPLLILAAIVDDLYRAGHSL